VALYLAKKNSKMEPDRSTQVEITPILFDEVSRLLWIWVPAFQTKTSSPEELILWNPEVAQTGAIDLASMDPRLVYRGLVGLRISSAAVKEHRAQMAGPALDAAPWPSGLNSLREVVDAIPANEPNSSSSSLVKSVVLCIVTPQRSYKPTEELSLWLEHTAVPTAELSLGTNSGFAASMTYRPALFKELADIVKTRRIVFLLGGPYSYVSEFIDGFCQYILVEEQSSVKHVVVKYDVRAFGDLCQSNVAKMLPYHHLDCLFASIAYCAVKRMRPSGTEIRGFFTAEMAGAPQKFAELYLKKATQHRNQWDSTRHFLGFLTGALKKSEFNGHLTIMLPFDSIAEVINGEDGEGVRPHLWEGLGALREKFANERDSVPGLGLVFTAPRLALDDTVEDKLLRHSILVLPALSY